jgi:membrane protease YdiL (CAAX protease family)
MQIPVLALLLLAVLSVLSKTVCSSLQRVFERRAWLILLAPLLFAGLFAAVAARAGAVWQPLALLALVYTGAPVLVAWAQRGARGRAPSAADFAILLMLWLPLEFAAGERWVPRQAQGFLHSVAYGIAILLALAIFAGFRRTPGMKCNLPCGAIDLKYVLAGYAIAAPVLAVLGIALGFITWPHAPVNTAPGFLAGRFLVIFAATGLPEEILFRSLVQNFLMLRFGATNGVLAVSSLIFGCAHLNNGPAAALNWRYMVLASVAGFAFGKVFQKSSSVLSPAALHAMVDATKHFFF